MKRLFVVGILIVLIIITGCTCSIKEPQQERIIGIIANTEYHNFFDDSYVVTLTSGDNLYFKKESSGSTSILVKDFSEVKSWKRGEQYEWIIEKDPSCGSNKPWILISAQKIITIPT
jgi:hypothetical protein